MITLYFFIIGFGLGVLFVIGIDGIRRFMRPFVEARKMRKEIERRIKTMGQPKP